MTFIIAAYPTALLAEKWNRRLIIKIGIVIFGLGLIIAFFIENLTILTIASLLIGFGYACININTLATVWSLAPSPQKIGTYTGVYYFFMYLAEISGPGIVGAMTDLFGWNFFFLNCAIFIILAFIFVMLVQREEVELTEKEKEIMDELT
ncbi:MAG: MFS transporter [Candidatus Aenigmatarchaeota archaeon]